MRRVCASAVAAIVVSVVLSTAAPEALAADPASQKAAGPGVPFSAAPSVLYREDPVLPAGTPPIENDIILLLRVTIDVAGSPTDVRLAKGPLSLAPAVIEAVKRWRFREGEPLETMVGINLLSRGRAEAGGPLNIARGPMSRIREVRPRYPPDALRTRTRGTLLMEALVDSEGIVGDVFVMRPVEGLTEAALASVMGWRYAPRPGHPPVRMVVTQRFDAR